MDTNIDCASSNPSHALSDLMMGFDVFISYYYKCVTFSEMTNLPRNCSFLRNDGLL